MRKQENVEFPAFAFMKDYFVTEIFNPSARNSFKSVVRFGVV